ncbi:MAG: radical SAM family heme chaperone HemW [Clostridia bacterium]|nr:radical SAM family heme chaperone HemW [Clostridia bacterium]
MRGLYIHIPFCRSKCPYCDFNSYANIFDLAEDYTNAVICEMSEYPSCKIGTVYFGGGTPSAINPQYIAKILEAAKKHFDIAEGAEITMEANPGTLESVEVYKEAGINRISLGVQSFNDNLLKTLGRIHSGEDAKNAVYMLKKAGFDNISIDLMFSLPGQTPEMWKKDIEIALSLPITHISCYGLKVEEGTPFAKSGVTPQDEETDRHLYHMLIDALKENGFSQYEISNFALAGFESRHNLVYWKCGEYIGLGAGAHSYFEGSRYNNIYNVGKYIKGGKIRENICHLSDKDKAEEKIILQMRLTEGVNRDILNINVGNEKIDEYIRMGYMQTVGDKVAFTTDGMDVSNYILSDLI